MDAKLMGQILEAQQNEITEHFIYLKLSQAEKNEKNKKVLKKISDDELGHHNFWKQYTQKEVKARWWDQFKYYWIAKILGITFGIKLMEAGEKDAQSFYEKIVQAIPESKKVLDDEAEHEKALIALIEEEKLNYIGSIVLGLSDALVELTGTLAGLTFALQNSKIVALAGFITGIAASLSMGASEYLSQKHEPGNSNPFKASLYTGAVYVTTVLILIAPYMILGNPFQALAFMLVSVVVIIFAFNFYISVAKDLPFKRRFLEMVSISLGVAGISFLIGIAARKILGIEI